MNFSYYFQQPVHNIFLLWLTETGIIINSSRLRFIGFSNGDNEKDPKGGQIHVRIFFSYEFLAGEKILVY